MRVTCVRDEVFRLLFRETPKIKTMEGEIVTSRKGIVDVFGRVPRKTARRRWRTLDKDQSWHWERNRHKNLEFPGWELQENSRVHDKRGRRRHRSTQTWQGRWHQWNQGRAHKKVWQWDERTDKTNLQRTASRSVLVHVPSKPHIFRVSRVCSAATVAPNFDTQDPRFHASTATAFTPIAQVKCSDAASWRFPLLAQESWCRLTSDQVWHTHTHTHTPSHNPRFARRWPTVVVPRWWKRHLL